MVYGSIVLGRMQDAKPYQLPHRPVVARMQQQQQTKILLNYSLQLQNSRRKHTTTWPPGHLIFVRLQ